MWDFAVREDRRPDAEGADVLVVVDGDRLLEAAADFTVEPAKALDTTRPLSTVRFSGGEELDGRPPRAWHAIAVMAAAESVGVAARMTA